MRNFRGMRLFGFLKTGADLSRKHDLHETRSLSACRLGGLEISENRTARKAERVYARVLVPPNLYIYIHTYRSLL